jgi:GT2 family glycosyltransferase
VWNKAFCACAGGAPITTSWPLERKGGRQLSRRSSRHANTFRPLEVIDIDLAHPPEWLRASARPQGGRYEKAFALIRFDCHPVGHVELDLCSGDLSRAQLMAQVWAELGERLPARAEPGTLPPISAWSEPAIPAGINAPCSVAEDDLPPVSVVIATRGRPDALASCLESIRKVDYPTFEVIVVDNAPEDCETARVVGLASEGLPQLRYVVERTPGASVAKNRGVAEASSEIIAFTDDDVVVAEGWLRGLVRGFESVAGVGCVTGLVLAAELETPSQLWFEQYGGFSRGYGRKVFDSDPGSGETRIYPFSPGAFGAGASAAFRADVLHALGGFDPSLGPGTVARGGEDLDLFLRVVLSGHRLVYEPSAVAWHRHRREYPELRRQIHDYGVGLTALITKLLLSRETAWEVIKRVPHGLALLLSPTSPKNASKLTGYPPVLSLLELAGMARGPFAYLRSRSCAAAPDRRRVGTLHEADVRVQERV